MTTNDENFAGLDPHERIDRLRTIGIARGAIEQMAGVPELAEVLRARHAMLPSNFFARCCDVADAHGQREDWYGFRWLATECERFFMPWRAIDGES